MGSAAEKNETDAYPIARANLSLEDARLYQTRLESKHVDCLIGSVGEPPVDAAAEPALRSWWIKVHAAHRGAAHEMIAALDRSPVVLVRRDATWKYAFIASVLIMPINYSVLTSTRAPLLSMVLTVIVVGLAALIGHQRAAYVCSDPRCLAENEQESEWCAKCGAKIEAVVERPGLIPKP